VNVAYDGRAGSERIAVHDYDVVVLDRGLPGVSGSGPDSLSSLD